MHERKGFFARVGDLWRGLWGVRLSRAEVRHAEAVYHQAIQEQKKNYDELKRAASRLIYLRNRVQTELDHNRGDLALIEDALRRAALADDDAKALKLIEKQRELHASIARGEADIEKLNREAEAAKESLRKLASGLEDLNRERHEMLARKAHAEAQLSAQAALENALARGGSGHPALENVREAIHALESDAGLGGTTALPGELSMSELRKEAQGDADKDALAALKTQLRGRLLTEGKSQGLARHSSSSGVST